MRQPKLQLLFDYAEQGRTVDMRSLLNNNNSSVFQCHEDEINPLDCAIEHNHLDCVKLLVGLYNPKEASNYPLTVAARLGFVDITKFLIPVSDPYLFVDVLCDVILTPDNPCFEVLLPHLDPKALSSRALQIASSVENQHYFDVLYPLSDPKIALKSMEINPHYREKQKTMLRQRLTSEYEHAEISQHIRGGQQSVVRKM